MYNSRNYFMTGREDQSVEIWLYNDCKATHVGKGHVGAMTSVRMNPDSKYEHGRRHIPVAVPVRGRVALGPEPYNQRTSKTHRKGKTSWWPVKAATVTRR
uniref:WD repeat-containing protein 16 n=1 Tax=Sipha flava TaxID=143950 RepID=A0A2S2Q2U5_9HEMI